MRRDLSYSRLVNPASAILRWVASRQAAEDRERAEMRRSRQTPAQSFAGAMSLIAFAASRHGWPLPAGPEEAADDLAFHETWARLRRIAGAE